jgi:hypothetical protein
MKAKSDTTGVSLAVWDERALMFPPP